LQGWALFDAGHFWPLCGPDTREGH
jgi:hypothetical protein